MLLRLLGILNTVIDGPTVQCEVSNMYYNHVIYYNYYRRLTWKSLQGEKVRITEDLEVSFLYSELQR